MSRPPQLLLFDLDGCLVDSTRAITTCMNRALVELGLTPRRVEELTRFIGPPLVSGFTTMLEEADADAALVGPCVDRYRKHYPDVARAATTVVPGIPEVLAELSTAVPMAVVTSKPGVFAIPILQEVDLLDRFLAVHGPAADHAVEPKSVTLSRALEELLPGTDPATSAMIGDRSHDVLAGKDCGTGTVGVTWGAGDARELEDAGADQVVSAPTDLLDLLS